MRGQDLIHGQELSSRIRRRAAVDRPATPPTAHPLVGLQRKIGNAQVARLLAQREAAPEEEELQAKRDPALQRQAAPEEEELQTKRDPSVQRAAEDEEEVAMTRDPAIQRQAAPEEEELQAKRDPALQRAAEEEEEIATARADGHVTPEVGLAGGPISAGLSSRIEARRGAGSSLDQGTRQSMESSFGRDFSDVRLHADAEADTLNRSVGAKAFTVGSDIFFSRNARPSDSQLLAHELTHVVQQDGAKGSSGPLTVSAANDSSEAEADTMASSVLAGGASVQAARETDEKAG